MLCVCCVCICWWLCCLCAASLPGSVRGVVSWERTVTTCCFRMQENNTDGRAELIALLRRSSKPLTPPRTHHHPSHLPHCDTNTVWQNLMKFCSLKQVACCRDGGVKGRYENLSALSAHLFLWIVSTGRSMRRFSPGLSALSPIIEGCKFTSETGLTLLLSGTGSQKHRSSAINRVKASFLRRPTEREGGRPFPSKFSLSILTRWGCERTLGKVHLFLNGEAPMSEKKK